MIFNKGAETAMGRGQSVQQMMLGKPDIHMQRYSYLILYKKLTHLIKDLNVRPKTIKLLEENRGKLKDIQFSSDFLDMIPKTQAIKLKINGTPSNFRTPWHKKQHSEKHNLWGERKYFQIMYLIRD